MTVLTVASSKGGPGKTTIIQLLAGRLLADGHDVVLVDADPVAALSRWAARTWRGLPLKCIHETDETRLAQAVVSASEFAEVVLVDTAGSGNRAAALAVAAADAVLVPYVAGEADVTEAANTLKLVRGLAAAARREIPARLLLNRRQNTSLVRHAASETEALPRLESALSLLVAFGEVSYTGRTPEGGRAGAELDALVSELRALRWLPGVDDATLAPPASALAAGVLRSFAR